MRNTEVKDDSKIWAEQPKNRRVTDSRFERRQIRCLELDMLSVRCLCTFCKLSAKPTLRIQLKLREVQAENIIQLSSMLNCYSKLVAQ